MRSQASIFVLTLILVLGSASVVSAQAQYNTYNQNQPLAPPYSQRPALSPFLNLLRGGDPAANYYLGVLPEVSNRNFQKTYQNFAVDSYRNQLFLDDRLELDVPIRQLPPTGHTAGFMIYNNYYNVPNNRGFIPYNPRVGPQNPQVPR
jgi:hypothetical protein